MGCWPFAAGQIVDGGVLYYAFSMVIGPMQIWNGLVRTVSQRRYLVWLVRME